MDINIYKNVDKMKTPKINYVTVPQSLMTNMNFLNEISNIISCIECNGWKLNPLIQKTLQNYGIKLSLWGQGIQNQFLWQS